MRKRKPKEVVAPVESQQEEAPQEEASPSIPPLKGNWLQPPYERFEPPTEEVEDEKGKPYARLAFPRVPSAWRDGGHLVLVVGARTDKKNVRLVEFVSTEGDGELASVTVDKFWTRVGPIFPEAAPVQLAASMLARQHAGIFTMRIAELQRVVAMITPERLAELTDEQLATDYRKLVDPRAPDKIKGNSRDEAIEKILARAREIGAKVVVDAEGKPNKKIKAPKPPKEPKEKKEKAPKEPKQKKVREKRELTINPNNPYREGSMKRKAYDVFVAEKGNREKVIEATVALGATKSTASSWYSAFCKV